MEQTDREKLKAWITANSLDVFSRDDISVFKRTPDTFDDWEMVSRLGRFWQFRPRYVDVKELIKFLDSL